MLYNFNGNLINVADIVSVQCREYEEWNRRSGEEDKHETD